MERNEVNGVYQTVIYEPRHTLTFHLYPAEPSKPVLVFYFGGGWINGSLLHFHEQAVYFSKLGYPCVCAEYRTSARYPGSTPFDCFEDTCSLLQFLQENQSRLNLDMRKLILCGGSAGGQLALCNAILCDFVQPIALLLFNPVTDTTKQGYAAGAPRFQGKERSLSPYHLLQKRLPPTFIVHGTADRAVPVQSILDFVQKARRLGTSVTLQLYAGRGHGFFNHPSFRPESSLEDYRDVLAKAKQFIEFQP